jgi:hypothetical protein
VIELSVAFTTGGIFHCAKWHGFSSMVSTPLITRRFMRGARVWGPGGRVVR